jgi:hypothetical protein
MKFSGVPIQEAVTQGFGLAGLALAFSAQAVGWASLDDH